LADFNLEHMQGVSLEEIPYNMENTEGIWD